MRLELIHPSKYCGFQRKHTHLAVRSLDLSHYLLLQH